MSGTAHLTGPRGDVLAWNITTTALFGDWSVVPDGRRNWGRFLFGSPGQRDLLASWRAKAPDYVGYLRGNRTTRSWCR
ncbi:hypothetical protein BJY18_007096 [Amycolatopsis jiangsuensis]|uniref:MmyB-like transcription regulator ligand binding domain-containing protein n=1 Tax=Amycolatopsis jiangsuensis TaxID=1181879 RepID=A0A840J3G9_9PSEU|nr:hypothetical protein [Amycolatopsis jiangsuensis]MBB4689611.1 hypothetical protein [Amycolatopsis jiangsuensis]